MSVFAYHMHMHDSPVRVYNVFAAMAVPHHLTYRACLHTSSCHSTTTATASNAVGLAFLIHLRAPCVSPPTGSLVLQAMEDVLSHYRVTYCTTE
jgi:hypothetical protein